MESPKAPCSDSENEILSVSTPVFYRNILLIFKKRGGNLYHDFIQQNVVNLSYKHYCCYHVIIISVKIPLLLSILIIIIIINLFTALFHIKLRGTLQRLGKKLLCMWIMFVCVMFDNNNDDDDDMTDILVPAGFYKFTVISGSIERQTVYSLT